MEGTTIRICVLASGSSGNLAVLAIDRGSGTGPPPRDVYLLDAGLSPRRAHADFRLVGVDPGEVRGAVITHLDRDHYHPGWIPRLPAGAVVHMHERHARAARHAGIAHPGVRAFRDAFDLGIDARVTVVMASHDALGVAAFRFDFADASLGYATDVGRATPELLHALAGVDVLAIESNYCPRMQLASGRPDSLKRRVMGGSGHLSNEQCLRAVETIAPRHAIFLHLSRECNDPSLVAGLHEGADYEFTIASQDRPTRWVRISPGPSGARTSGARALDLPAPLFAPRA